ncbi:hypothetical protein QBC46DRAFT_250286 [Diplogelasinospora grovesii]|uniref:Uncharacterized protein n=1 Tax=Diplogelasinospora grovesii TaxID=303347 RepID=A0AAN6NFQ0_9PEZI|nr:hypothetical protein QBC46DRAFT_250286 [Diplogelasinospora grovesii]
MADRNAAARRYAEVQAARRNATAEEIQKRGLEPDMDALLDSVNEQSSDRPAPKRTKLDSGAARKIYATTPGGGPPPSSSSPHSTNPHFEAENDPDLKAVWQELRSHPSFQGLSAAQARQYLDLARSRLSLLRQADLAFESQYGLRSARQSRHSKPVFDLIGSLSTCTELIVEVCKHVRPIDIVNLYSISRSFHAALDAHMQSSIVAWARVMAPTSSRIFSGPIYKLWFIRDPAGRPVDANYYDRRWMSQPESICWSAGPVIWNKEIRTVPGLLWFQMVVSREIRVRDIIATLARWGHRLPPGAYLTLKKMWLVMDIAANKARMALFRQTSYFTNLDLYILQMFFVKLVLLTNDPYRGPGGFMLMQLLLGQRSLSALWSMLRRKPGYRTMGDFEVMKIRYDIGPSDDQLDEGLPVKGVPLEEMGAIHFEGWGAGDEHLLRPDELVAIEACRRQLELEKRVTMMMIYGHVDVTTGQSLVPTLEEMYMSDDEYPCQPTTNDQFGGVETSGCGNVPFQKGMWLPKHARKARWESLTAEEKWNIILSDRKEMEFEREVHTLKDRYKESKKKVAELISERAGGAGNKKKWEIRVDGEDDDDTTTDTEKSKSTTQPDPNANANTQNEDDEDKDKDADGDEDEEGGGDPEIQAMMQEIREFEAADEKLKAQADYDYDEEDLDFDYEDYIEHLQQRHQQRFMYEPESEDEDEDEEAEEGEGEEGLEDEVEENLEVDQEVVEEDDEMEEGEICDTDEDESMDETEEENEQGNGDGKGGESEAAKELAKLTRKEIRFYRDYFRQW